MYAKDDKRRIYQLINMYLDHQINESGFCNEFYYSYDLELNTDLLAEDEYKAFSELSEVTGRFSQFAEDHIEHPGVFYTKEEVNAKIIETKKKLKKYFDRLKSEL